MRYRIQHKIETLAENAVNAHDKAPSFETEAIKFTHWDFSHGYGWRGDAWLAVGEVEAANLTEAYRSFRDKLVRIVPRIAFVSQCYTEFGSQPFLITKAGSDIGYFYDAFDSDHVGLMFEENQESALSLLLIDKTIPEEFFLYWNDAVNTIGYSSKLLIMFSAIEALAKKPNGKKDWALIESILGEELKEEIFKQNSGLRHRLTHGEHFSIGDFSKNYVEIIHNKVIDYFNDFVLKSKLLSNDVVEPQRHFFGNKMLGKCFITPRDKATPFDLASVIEDFHGSTDSSRKFDLVHDDTLTKGF